MNPVSVSRIEGNSHRFGGDIDSSLSKVLEGCPTPDDIHAHLSEFNDEITSTHGDKIISAKEEAERQSRITLEEAAKKLNLGAQSRGQTAKQVVPEAKDVEIKVSKTEGSRKNLSRKIINNVTYRRKPDPHLETTKMIMAAKGIDESVIKEYDEQNKELEKQIKNKKEVKMSSENMSLDEELQELDKKVEEATAASEPEVGVTKGRVMEALSKLPNAPTENHVKRWKQELGEDGVHVTVFSEREIYIYKHLTRSQWQKVQEMIAKMQQAKSNVSEDELKEKVVTHCVLWPSLTLEWKYQSRAGVLDALYQAIMLQSYFLSPQQVMSLSCEL